MPLSGPEPKPNARRRNAPTHDWTEVPNTPFDGTPPVRPPTTRTVVIDGKTTRLGLTAMARSWWRTVAAMPHCRLWSESDWLFAAETVLIADDFYRGNVKSAAELRQRERVLGTTADARTALRIRYVDQEDDAGEQSAARPGAGGGGAAAVTRLEDRRRRLTGDAP